MLQLSINSILVFPNVTQNSMGLSNLNDSGCKQMYLPSSGTINGNCNGISQLATRKISSNSIYSTNYITSAKNQKIFKKKNMATENKQQIISIPLPQQNKTKSGLTQAAASFGKIFLMTSIKIPNTNLKTTIKTQQGKDCQQQLLNNQKHSNIFASIKHFA